jgi:hypothetical protein
MRKETVSVNQKEQQRVKALNQIERGELTGKDASGLMDVAVRPRWRGHG